MFLLGHVWLELIDVGFCGREGYTGLRACQRVEIRRPGVAGNVKAQVGQYNL